MQHNPKTTDKQNSVFARWGKGLGAQLVAALLLSAASLTSWRTLKAQSPPSSLFAWAGASSPLSPPWQALGFVEWAHVSQTDPAPAGVRLLWKDRLGEGEALWWSPVPTHHPGVFFQAQDLPLQFQSTASSLSSWHSTPLDAQGSLQWHNLMWPWALGERSSALLFQRHPQIRARSEMERQDWDPLFKGEESEERHAPPCPGHTPQTPQWFRLWGMELENRAPLYFLDGTPDLQHPDISTQNIVLESAPTGTSASEPSLHGTHTLSVAVGAWDSRGITGVRPGLKTRVFPLPAHNAQLSHMLELLENARLRAKLSHEKAVLYLGSLALSQVGNPWEKKNSPLFFILQSLEAQGFTVVLPAGNRSSSMPTFRLLPVDMPMVGRNTLRVYASDMCSRPAWFTRRPLPQDFRPLFAPGEHIYGAFPHGDFGFLTGTSQAAAQVSAFLTLFDGEGGHRVRLVQNSSKIFVGGNGKALMPDAGLWLRAQGQESASLSPLELGR